MPKTLHKVHCIKRRLREGLKTFIDRSSLKATHNTGVPPELRISSFMHGMVIPKLVKKANEKLPKMVDEMGHNTNDCYQLKKQIEEVVASEKLAHLVKDIRQSNQRNRSQGRNGVKVINMINGGRNRKRPYEVERSGLTEELTFLAIP
ncbi:hypothetical protein Tco_0393017 [Tanacetum coccineum]